MARPTSSRPSSPATAPRALCSRGVPTANPEMHDMTEQEQSASAWYIGADRAEVGEAAILVGDPARIARLATHMSDVRAVRENRGLATITGTRAGRRITASAFGMGAPIAAIVLHELFALGIRTF